FSWPSTAPVVSAGRASVQLIWVGLAPSALKVSRNSGEPTTRTFRPLRSAGWLIGPRELEISRKPFSAQASGITPRFSIALNTISPALPVVMASTAALSGIRKGRENRLTSGTWGDQLMVEPTAMSISPLRMAENSRVWSPDTSCALGYTLSLMRPSLRSSTSSAHLAAAWPQGKASDSTVETEYSRGWANAMLAVRVMQAAPALIQVFIFIGCSPVN